MRLRRSTEGSITPATDTVQRFAAAWVELPARAAGEPVIRAPRAGDPAVSESAPPAPAPLRREPVPDRRRHPHWLHRHRAA